jgi:hypothetical protein
MKAFRDILIEDLSFRIERIENISKSSTIGKGDNQYKDFYLEIAHFVHFIFKNDSLKRFYLELISVNKTIKEEPEYIKAVGTINILIQKIALCILDRDDFKEFVKENDYGFLNPISNGLPTEKPEIILRNLHCYNATPDGRLKDTIENIHAVFIEIINKFKNKTNFESVSNHLDNYVEQYNIITYFEEFEYHYKGSNSAFNLLTIYKSLMPLAKIGNSTYEKIQDSLIKQGKAINDNNIERLINDCHKVFYYLKKCLHSNLSIEFTIDRFIAFMTLYFERPLTISKPEKALQRKFEEFMFSNGYYPISEAQVSNGRIDTLIINETNSFLFEFKQLSLGTKTENVKDLNKKLSSAKVQSKIYHDRLLKFPFLSKTIFIIVFTDRQISFENSINIMAVDNLRFLFKTVNISRLSPSEQPSEIIVNIKDLIKKNGA